MSKRTYKDLFPEISDKVNSRIEQVVQREVNSNNDIVPAHKRLAWKIALVAALIVVVPFGAYAANHIYYTFMATPTPPGENSDEYKLRKYANYLEQQIAEDINTGNSYEKVTVVVTPDEKGDLNGEIYITDSSAQGRSLSGEYQTYLGNMLASYRVFVNDKEILNSESDRGPCTLSLGYIPADLEADATSPNKYNSVNFSRALSVWFYRVPEGGIWGDSDYITDCTRWTTSDGDIAMYLEKEVDHGWNQLWISFADTSYAALMYVKGLSEEEIRQLAEEATLVSADSEEAVLWKPDEVVEFKPRDVEIAEEVIVRSEHFPVLLHTNEVDIEVLDYHFENSYPEEFEKQVDLGDTDKYVFLVMDVNVHNNFDTEYEYSVNMAYVTFGASPESVYQSSGHYMNELVYFSKNRHNGYNPMIYDFEPKETYTATYVFRVDRRLYEDDSLTCCLLVNTNGAAVLDENDRIFGLDKKRMTSGKE